MKETVTYLIKRSDSEDELFLSNRPLKPDDAKYGMGIQSAREFNGMEDASIDMTKHKAIKKIVTETTKYEEVNNEF